MEKKWQFNEKFRSDAAHLSVQSRCYIYLIQNVIIQLQLIR